MRIHDSMNSSVNGSTAASTADSTPGSPSRHRGRAGTACVALGAAVTLLLAGCGSGDAPAEDADPGDPAVVTTPEATESPSPEASESEQPEDAPSDDAESASPEDEGTEPEESENAEASEEETGAAEEESTPPEAEKAMEPSDPTSFSIDAIGASSELLHLGLRDDDTLEVPPGDPGSPASWFTGSPTPGEVGPAVLLGHVDDSAGQPGVFAALPELEPGDRIDVAREDGSDAEFEVTKAEQYGKDDFPTLQVYGNTPGPELRLITCDGYNESTGAYEDNYVVYAELVD